MNIPEPKQVFALAVQRGKYRHDRTLLEELADIDAELDELKRAVRLMAVKVEVENEFADIVLAAMSLSYRYGLDIETAINRKYRHHGGK